MTLPDPTAQAPLNATFPGDDYSFSLDSLVVKLRARLTRDYCTTQLLSSNYTFVLGYCVDDWFLVFE